MESIFNGTPYNSYNILDISKARQKIKKTRWTTNEDLLLQQAVQMYGTSSWTKIAEMIPNRDGKQCRERYNLHFAPNINCNPWTPEEDQILIEKQALFGNSWTKIAPYFVNRSTINIKNRWKFLKNHSFSTVTTPKPEGVVEDQQFIQEEYDMVFDDQLFEMNDYNDIFVF